MNDTQRIDPAAQRAPVKSTTEARQGVTGHNASSVLLWSTGAAIIALVVIFFVYFTY